MRLKQASKGDIIKCKSLVFNIQNIIRIMNSNRLQEIKAVYMKEKSQQSLQQCFQRCNKGNNDFKSVTNRQITCVEYCSIKMVNAYSYAFDILQNGGVARASESTLRGKVLK